MTHPLTTARNDAKLSAAQLAKLCGCSRQTIFRIEAGLQTPTLTLVAKITTALRQNKVKLSADAFLPGDAA